MEHLHAPIRVEADLIVDTQSMKRIAGVRTRGSRQRHLLYRAGHLYVDLQLRQLPVTGELQMIGQVLGEIARTTEHSLSLALTCGDETVLETTTDEMGEFLFTCAHASPSTLEVFLGDELTLQLPIPKAPTESPEDPS